ncbi:MAG: hypothetical protein KBS97_02620 [Firmicutes bacterium]|nr:hypothetical protein [Candidatus Fiminaster equi]
MKKGLLIFSIITTVITAACFCYSAGFFGVYLQGIRESKAGAQVAGIIFFVIFNFFTMGASVVNLIPNTIHFVKCRKPVVIVFFAIAVFLLVASATMLGFVLYNQK